MDDLLRYQRDRTLGDVEGYAAGLQTRLSDDTRVYLALSATELAVYFADDRAVHYDLAGRLTMVAEPNRYWRRSLSHRVRLSQKRSREEGGGLARALVSPAEADRFVARTQTRVAQIAEQLRTGAAVVEFGKPTPAAAREILDPQLARAAAFTVTAAHRSADEFQAVYGQVAVLPPDQYNALVLQATAGCAYAGCTFCELYRGVPYQRKTPAEFREHVRAAVAFHGEALRARRSIFLGEANALTLPQPALLEMFGVLGEFFEWPAAAEPGAPVAADSWLGQPRRFDGVSTFLDAFLGPDRSATEFAALRQAGLRRVYLGMETGDDALLRWLHKPATADSINQTVAALKEAGLAVGLIILLGAGGRPFAEAHVRETVQVVNGLPLGRGDYVYFSPLVIEPGGRYAAQAAATGERLTGPELDAQEQALRAALRFDSERGRPYLARYELETFIY